SLTLILHWDGAQWSLVPSPNPGSSTNILSSIAIVSANDIWAVGTYYGATTVTHTLVEHWDGAQWRVVPSPDQGSASNGLSSVSAVAANDVWAVGTYGNNNLTGQTLIMHWDGAQWSVGPSPNGGQAGTRAPRAVVALAANDAWAVGSYGSHALTLHWNGTQWAVVPTANPGMFS